jgi:hypothetical protein
MPVVLAVRGTQFCVPCLLSMQEAMVSYLQSNFWSGPTKQNLPVPAAEAEGIDRANPDKTAATAIILYIMHSIWFPSPGERQRHGPHGVPAQIKDCRVDNARMVMLATRGAFAA